MRNSITIILALFFSYTVSAKNELRPSLDIIYGYNQTISSSEDIAYHSHLSSEGHAMIVRMSKDHQKMVWLSQPLPQTIKGNDVTFVWMSGFTGLAYKEPGQATLSVNGKKIGTFTVGVKYAFNGIEGTKFIFHEKMRDENGDCFGFMELTVPKSLIEAGKPVELSFEAKCNGQNNWLMVFKHEVTDNGLTVNQPMILNKNEGNQTYTVDYLHLGAPEKAVITFDGIKYKRNLTLGVNQFSFTLKNQTFPKKSNITIQSVDKSLTQEVVLQQAKHWDVNFIQFSHTDIGYTRPQTDIMSEHVRFIDYALDYCDQTDNYPENAKFRWTCEDTWAVTSFLHSRPQKQIDRFVKRVKEGRIELTAMYLNFDGLTDERSLAASLYPLKEYKRYGLDNIKVAMQNDTNGIGWSMSEFLPDVGIKYLTMGVNVHKAIAPFDIPTYFWWVSPSGKKILTYYGPHYGKGNSIGVNGTDFARFEKNMFDYLNSLSKKGYKYDNIGLEFLGIGGDNSAPSTYACKNVIKWNKKYDYPKIRLSLFKDYLGKIEAKYGKELVEIRGAWPDWWTDGFASGARETAAIRQTHGEIISNLAGLSMAKLNGSKIPNYWHSEIDNINRSILFYDEHTFGASGSITAPFTRETMNQRAIKASFAYEAFRHNRLMREAAFGFLNESVSPTKEPTLIVYNPMSWDRTSVVSTYVDFSIIPTDKKVIIRDEQGNKISAQLIRRLYDGAYWKFLAKDIPALGYKQYYIEQTNEDISVKEPKKKDVDTISNRWYDITFNMKKGTIKKLYDKQLQKQLLDSEAPYELGAMIHEQCERRLLHTFTLGKYKRNTPSSMQFVHCQEGEIWDTWTFTGHTNAGMDDGNNLTVEYRIFKECKRIELNYKLNKKLNINPEAIYISFPYKLPEAKIYYEVPGGEIEAGVDQIIGSANDWDEVQSYAAVRNKKEQIVMGSLKIPMMEFGAINTGRFVKGAVPQSNNIYSYVMNNYWITNFNADQHGEIEWNYFITSYDNSSKEAAIKAGWENNSPCLAKVLPAGTEKKNARREANFMTITPSNVLLVSMKPIKDEDAVLLQLREVNGTNSKIDVSVLTHKKILVQSTNVLGDIQPDNNLHIKGYASKFIKVSW